MKKIKKKIIFLYIIALLVLYSVIYLTPKLTDALISSYTVEYGEMKLSDETTGYIVRNEQVYVTGAGGNTNFYIDEGTMVRKGTSVMEITSSSDREAAEKYTSLVSRLNKNYIKTTTFHTESSGIISYHSDGYENKITPDNMEKKDKEYYETLSNSDVLDLKRSDVAKGEPVFKVVDRAHWYIVCFVDKKNADRYIQDYKVSMEFEDSTISVRVYSTKNMNGKTRVIFETNNYYEKFSQIRTADVNLVTASQTGLLILNSSIGEEKGVKGVYVKNKAGDYIFKPIKILLTDGEKSIVKNTYFYDDEGQYQNTVKTYDDVLKKAK